MAQSQPSPTSLFITTSSSFGAGLPRTALWCCSENKSRLTITCKLTVRERVTVNFSSISSLKLHTWRFILFCAECWNKICLCAVTHTLLCVDLPQTGFISFLKRCFDWLDFDHTRSLKEISILKSNLSQTSRNVPFLPAHKWQHRQAS